MRTRYARATALVAVVLASLCVESVVVAAGSCPKVPAHTLSSDCNGACESYQTCMAPASTTSASCRCFGKRKDQLVVLIPFGKTTAAQLAAASTTLFSNDDEAEAQSWASNDDLTKIAALSLSTLVTDVVIRGGSSSTVLPSREQRFVANVAFDKSFVSSLTQMTKLTVDNINLKASIAELAVNLPSNLLTLNLRNDRLIEFPTALTTLKALQRLDLELNYITDINPSHALSELTDLHLGSNQISTFTAVFPKLTYLDLGWNKLTVPPASLANHTRLETLFFDGNSISSFTQEYAVSSLKDLRFYNNTVMSEFDAILPNLDNLDLRYNSFTKFPLAVFNNTKLNTLELAYNKLSNVSFTNEQANFLNTLDGFSIDNSSLKSDCADSERFYFSNAKVEACISGGMNRAIIEGTRIIPETPMPATPAPSKVVIDTGSGNTTVIVGAVGGAFIVVVALIVGVFCCYRSKKRREKAGSTGMGVLTSGSDGASTDYKTLWNNPELLAVRVGVDEIQDVRKIGSGAFAEVWLVKLRKAQFAASKRLRKDQATLSRTQGFIKEITLVSTLQHPNIVQFMGAAWFIETDLQALFEFMEGGDLRSYLTDSRSPREWGTEKLQIAVDIAEALVYVHSFTPPLVHRDLKSPNVLLTTEARAKLTDFGVSRLQSEQNTMTAGVGTGRWLAPEVISGSLDYGPPSDIFSFGAVLSELDTHELPYESHRGAQGNKLADVAMLQLVSVGQLKPSVSASCLPGIAEIVRLCVAFKPEDRPPAIEVAYKLRTLLKQHTSCFV